MFGGDHGVYIRHLGSIILYRGGLVMEKARSKVTKEINQHKSEH